MARIRKRGANWNVEVRRVGAAPESASFPTKREAEEWAAELERKIRQGKHTIAHKRTLGDLLEKYGREVTPRKRGRDWEARRITWLLHEPLAALSLSELTPAKIATWRDSRLKTASGETVRRDFNLLSHALNVAIREWGWLETNPLAKVSRPQGNPPRERIASDDEIERLCFAAGYQVGQPATTATARAVAAFCFCVETGMRSGEALSLSAESVAGNAAQLRKTKNGDSREVALSARARQILDDVQGSFALTDSQRDSLWRKVVKRAGIEGLHFHDSRASAITRLAKKLDVLSLARMVGHRDIRMLQVYYRESAEEIAKRLG